MSVEVVKRRAKFNVRRLATFFVEKVLLVLAWNSSTRTIIFSRLDYSPCKVFFDLHGLDEQGG